MDGPRAARGSTCPCASSSGDRPSRRPLGRRPLMRAVRLLDANGRPAKYVMCGAPLTIEFDQAPDVVARCAGIPVVFEVVYSPWPTPLARAALSSANDQVLVTGLDLLVHQAALQFEQFTGRPASLPAMRAALP